MCIEWGPHWRGWGGEREAPQDRAESEQQETPRPQPGTVQSTTGGGCGHGHGQAGMERLRAARKALRASFLVLQTGKLRPAEVLANGGSRLESNVSVMGRPPPHPRLQPQAPGAPRAPHALCSGPTGLSCGRTKLQLESLTPAVKTGETRQVREGRSPGLRVPRAELQCPALSPGREGGCGGGGRQGEQSRAPAGRCDNSPRGG